MIRREIELAENERLWLLISQVDHAHLSGELTRNLQSPLSQEVIEAITHHDDGWAAWEAAPKLNPESGEPISFYEMPLEEALTIWDASIAAARKFGPLAGFIVAGHFYGLLSESEHGQQPAAVAWLAAKRKVRTAWLDEWVRADPTRTLDDAKRAQYQLLLADLFSLWLCGDAPIGGVDDGVLEQRPMKARAHDLLEQLHFTHVGFGRRYPTLDNPQEALAWVIAVDPYPFRESPLSLSLMGNVVPVAEYDDWSDLQAASRPMELRWRLLPPAAD
jgi:Protein of unknown function (DUF3891)